MNSTAPRLKSNELIDRLNDLRKSFSTISEFQYRQLEKEADALVRVDASDSYTIRGMIASVRMDAESARCYHEKAMAIAPNDSWVIGNYATSLSVLGFMDEAIRLKQRAYNISREVDDLASLINLSLDAGRPRTALAFLTEFERLSPDRAHELRAVAEDWTSHFEALSISDDDAASLMDHAYRLALSHKLLLCESRFSRRSDDDGTWVSFVVSVKAAVAEVARLNAELADVLSEHGLVQKMKDSFVVRYEPISA